MEGLIILLLALLIDIVLGDLPTALHPVGWMGKVISLLERFAPQRVPAAQLAYGAAMVLIVIALFVLPVYFVLSYLEEANSIAYVIVAGLLLKTSFSVRGLHGAATKIRGLLLRDNLDEARFHMCSLVSRSTKGIERQAIVAATVESVAENTSDSFVAPLFFFLLFGVPGAIAYRAGNTLDAMIGYHGKYEHLGKFAAKLDDLLNFIPARITGLVIVLSAFPAGKSTNQAWRTMLRDHGNTESPNAGWPMSAMAGALSVQLEKVGHYRLGDMGHPLVPERISESLKVMWIVVVLWAVIVFAVEVVYLVFASPS